MAKPTIEMILARPEAANKWRPPKEAARPSPKQQAEEMDLVRLKEILEFRVLTPQLPGARNIASALLPDPLVTYFAELGPGALAHYHLEAEDHTFSVKQREILSSDHPMMFVYGDMVDASQVEVNSGMATVVIPLFKGTYPFIVWVSDNVFVWVTFFWSASRELMLEILQSLA